MNQTKKPKQNHQKGKATARVSREDYYYNVRTKKFQSQGKQVSKQVERLLKDILRKTKNRPWY